MLCQKLPTGEVPLSDGLKVAALGCSTEVGSVAISRRALAVFRVTLFQFSPLVRVQVENSLGIDLLLLSESHDKLKWTP